MKVCRLFLMLLACMFFGLLAGCGGGGGGVSSPTSNQSQSISAPSELTATASGNQITLKWQPVIGATSYNVYWATTPHVTKSSSYKILNASSPYVHSELTNGVTYHYVVTALRDNIESQNSSETSIVSSKVIQIVANTNNAAVLKSDGTVWTWSDAEPTPTKVAGLISVTKIAAGTGFFVALKSDGTSWAWGRNSFGQLGDGTIVNRNTPVQVNIEDVVDVCAGQGITFAVKRDGTVWGWGWNSDGELGSGHFHLNDYKTAPVQVQGLSSVRSIYSYGSTTFAIRVDGTLWGWGLNFSGQIGDGTKTDRTVPVLVQGINNIKSLATSTYNGTYAVKNDGSLWHWGGTYSVDLVPTQVPDITNVSSSSSESSTLTVVKSDGTVWVDIFDQNLAIWRKVFTQVRTIDNAVYAAASLNLVLTSEGRVYNWRSNRFDTSNPITSVVNPTIFDTI